MPPSHTARAHQPSKRAQVAHLSTMEQFRAFTGSAPTIVKFTATWCGPCQRIAPVFAQLAAVHGVSCAEVDVDLAQEVAHFAGVRAMPTFQLWAQGQKVHGFEGAKEDDLRLLFQRAGEGADQKLS